MISLYLELNINLGQTNKVMTKNKYRRMLFGSQSGSNNDRVAIRNWRTSGRANQRSIRSGKRSVYWSALGYACWSIMKHNYV